MEKISLLILDDEQYVLSALKRLFRTPKYELFTAQSPDQALEILKAKDIGVMICDQRLGHNTQGTDFLEQTKQQYPEISRILLTGYFSSQIAKQSVAKSEVYRFLTKPWNDEDLRITVDNSWQRHKLMKQNRDLINVIRSQNDHFEHLTKNLKSVIENRIDRTVQSKNAIRAKKTQLQITHALIKGLGRSKNLQEIFKIVVKELQKLIPFDAASIVVEVNPHHYFLITSNTQKPFHLDQEPSLKAIFHTPQTEILKTELNIFGNKNKKLRSCLVFPLMDEKAQPKTCMATLNLGSFMRDIFTQDHIDRLIEIANPIAIAIEKMKLLEIVEQGAKQWESTFDAIGDLVTVIDKDFNLLKANRATEKITKQDVKNVIGKKCYEVLAQRKTPCKNCPAVTTLASKSVTQEHEIQDFKDKDYMSWSYPVFDAQKKLSSVVMYYRDQTALSHLFTQLIQSEKMAAIGNLASSLSHELNNPLTGITAFAQLLSKELGKDNPWTQDIEEIEKAAVRCKNIIENLLNFSEKPQTSQRSWTSIHEIIDATFPLIQYSKSATQNIEIQKKYFQNLPKIKANGNELQQVFFNLLLNAIQAMPKGGVLTVKTQPLPQKKAIQVTFSDTGIGIAKKDLKRIFDPFYTTKEKTRGTGLGLSVSYGIIQDHQGEIEVSSQLNKGSIFKVILPIKESSH